MNCSSPNTSHGQGSPVAAESLRNEIAEIEIANRMLADFAAVVSHDAQGAMRRIVSSAELLNLLPTIATNSHTRAFLQTILGSTLKIQGIMDDALLRPSSLFTQPHAAEERPLPLPQRLAEVQAFNRELSQVASFIASQLRDPLIQILSLSRMLTTLPTVETNPVAVDLASQIVAGAAKLNYLVDDYLAFSRSPRKELKRQSVSLATIIELARHELEHATVDRNVSWQIHPLPFVEGDASMLRQAILNLLSNCLKFSRTRSETRIEIGVQSDSPEFVFFVRDNGVGFDPSLASKLFTKFERLPASQTFEGSGVGLAIVQHIIERHGGKVWADGLPNLGATFYIALPQQNPP